MHRQLMLAGLILIMALFLTGCNDLIKDADDLYKERDYYGAIQLYEQYLNEYGNEGHEAKAARSGIADCYFRIAEQHYDHHEYMDAINNSERALKYYPSHKNAKKMRDESIYMAGMQYVKKGDYERALRFFKKSKSSKARNGEAEAFLSWGMELKKKGKTDAALTKLKTVEEKYSTAPAYPEALVGLFDIYIKTKKTDEAVDAAMKLFTADNNRFNTIIDPLWDIVIAKKKFEAADRIINNYRPKGKEIYNNKVNELFNAYRKAGDIHGAIRTAELKRSISSEAYQDALFLLFNDFVERKLNTEALEAAEKLHAINPDYKYSDRGLRNSEKLMSRMGDVAETYYNSGKYDEAVKVIRRYKIVRGYNEEEGKRIEATIWVAKGKTFLHEGNIDAAKREFDKARGIFPMISDRIEREAKDMITRGDSYLSKMQYYTKKSYFKWETFYNYTTNCIGNYEMALYIAPDSKTLKDEKLPKAYATAGYGTARLGRYFLYTKKNITEAFDYLKLGKPYFDKAQEYNAENTYVQKYYAYWEKYAGVYKRKAREQLPKIYETVRKNFNNGKSIDICLKYTYKGSSRSYKNYKIQRWQGNIIGTKTLGGTEYVVYELDTIRYYARPNTDKMDQTRFFQFNDDNAKKKMEAVIKGKVVDVQEQFGEFYLIIEVDDLLFTPHLVE